MREFDFKCVALQEDCGARTRDYVERQWRQAVERFEAWIRTVSIYVTDINGPRGGINKRCRIVVHTQAGAPIVIQETQEQISTAISRAIKRAAHTLKRKAAKKQDRKRQVLHSTTEPEYELENEFEHDNEFDYDD